MSELIVFTSQFAMVFFRLLNVRAVANNNIAMAATLTFLIQVFWLIASALGINAFLRSDWYVVVFYLLGGVIGSILQFKINVKDKK